IPLHYIIQKSPCLLRGFGQKKAAAQRGQPLNMSQLLETGRSEQYPNKVVMSNYMLGHIFTRATNSIFPESSPNRNSSGLNVFSTPFNIVCKDFDRQIA